MCGTVDHCSQRIATVRANDQKAGNRCLIGGNITVVSSPGNPPDTAIEIQTRERTFHLHHHPGVLYAVVLREIDAALAVFTAQHPIDLDALDL